MTTPPAVARTPLGAGYRWLLAAAANANLADGVIKVALPLLAIRLTRSPALVAGVGLAGGLPWLLTTLHAGALADRLDRRRTMLLANLLRAAILLAFAATIALELDRIWLLYTVAFTLGVAETLHDTSAGAFVPQLVGRDQLARANGRLYGIEVTANQFVGPPLGAFVVAATAITAVIVPSALFLLAALALARIPGSFRPEHDGPRGSLTADVRAGLLVLWNHRLLRTFAAMVGLMNLAGNAFMAVFVLFVVGPTSPMGLTEGAFGILLTVVAAGSILASLVAERVEAAIGRAWTLRLTIATGVVALVTPALTTSVWLVGAALAGYGAGIMLWNVVVVSFRQRVTPDHLLGRVNAGFRLLAWGTIPIGAGLGGLIGELFGLRAVFLVAGGLAASLLLVRITDRELDEADLAAAPTGVSADG